MATYLTKRTCLFYTVRRSRLFVVFFFYHLLALAFGQNVGFNETSRSCDALYKEGTEAYLDERWADCIFNFEQAIQSYRFMKQETISCRTMCQLKAEEAIPMFSQDVEDLNFFEKMIRKTLCLLKCKKRIKNIPSMILKELEQNFEDLKPYEYLHICYYQKNLIQKAASAVFTYLVQNPDDQAMMNNLKFYSSLPEVDMNTIVNFEVKDYVPLYIHGSEAYRNEDFQSVIGYIEESLDELLKEEEECRAFCEGPFDQGWFPDFVSSISNHFTFCLKCKQKCSSRLSSLNGEVHSDLLPSHYHFLQFAYYKVKNLQKACEAVSSYLLFFPNDETMLSNKKFYLTMPKVKPEYFTPRKEAINYIKRQQYEEALLNYIEKEFTFEDASDNEVSPSDSKKGLLLPQHTFD